MAQRRYLLTPVKVAVSSTRKRSLACRAEAREFLPTESVDGTMPPLEELARVLRVKNADESMLRLEEVMDRSTGLFRNSPDFAIPEVRFSQIEDGRFPLFVTRQVNRRGVLVVRGAVPADAALQWRDELVEYLEVNGLGDEPAGARDVFWSKAQAHAREHVRIRHILSALNRLWKPDALSPVDLTKSLSYCDRAFVGVPTCSSELSGGTAVIAGGPSACQRWMNPHHQQAYREIFEGRWEDWDPFKAGPRIRAAESSESTARRDAAGDAGSGAGATQAFRPFQGYLSLGRWGEQGNVHVVPMMRVATAYMLLRPFASDVFGGDSSPGDEDWLCGAGDGPGLALSTKWHQPILDALVRLPPLSPGDAVFWHTDVVHCEATAVSAATKARGNSDSDSTSGERPRAWLAGRGRGDNDGADGAGRFVPEHFAGVHLSSLPICKANSAYTKAQVAAFSQGIPPPDFADSWDHVSRRESRAGAEGTEFEARDESFDPEFRAESRFLGRAMREDLTRRGEQAMGMRSFRKEHSNVALERHHGMLGLDYRW